MNSLQLKISRWGYDFEKACDDDKNLDYGDDNDDAAGDIKK